MKIHIGVDVGGTEIKMGKFDGLNLIQKYSFPTNASTRGIHVIDDICGLIKEVAGSDEIVGIGMGVPAPVKNGFVFVAPNMGWKDVDVKSIIENAFPNVKVVIGNDANIAALGEKANGGAKEFDSYVFVTLGTGIGGGVVIDGQLVEGSNGAAGEIGHLCVVTDDGRKCGCGLTGCIERYASATGVVQTANEMRINRQTRLNDIEVTAKAVFDLAKSGDQVALEVVEDMTEKLSITLSQIANVVNPEAFIIGGGVSKAGSFLIDKLKEKFLKRAFPPQRSTQFALAKLGNDAGIYGACYAAYYAK